MKKLTMTKRGKELIADAINSNKKFVFSKIKTTSKLYNSSDIEDMIELEEIKQESLISSIEKISDTNLQIEAQINNSVPKLNDGYFVNGIGLYIAKDGVDVLYGVAIEDKDADYMPGFDEGGVNAISYKFDIVENVNNVELSISNSAIPSMKDMNSLKEVSIENGERVKTHATKSIISGDGIHGFKYDKSSKNFKVLEGNTWNTMEIDGAGKITTEGLRPENIRVGTNILIKSGNKVVENVQGNFTSDANATASDILSGKSAYVNGVKIYGSMVNNINTKNVIGIVTAVYYSGVHVYSYSFDNGFLPDKFGFVVRPPKDYITIGKTCRINFTVYPSINRGPLNLRMSINGQYGGSNMSVESGDRIYIDHYSSTEHYIMLIEKAN